MRKNWPTEHKDMRIAQIIMEKYAIGQNSAYLGLFELVLNQTEKRMKFRISKWVLALAEQYNLLYGHDQGEYVTRLVISRCMTQNEVLH